MKCSRCGEDKSEDEFHLRPGTKRGRVSHCRDCKSDKNRRHYQRSRTYILKKAKKRRLQSS